MWLLCGHVNAAVTLNQTIHDVTNLTKFCFLFLSWFPSFELLSLWHFGQRIKSRPSEPLLDFTTHFLCGLVLFSARSSHCRAAARDSLVRGTLTIDLASVYICLIIDITFTVFKHSHCCPTSSFILLRGVVAGDFASFFLGAYSCSNNCCFLVELFGGLILCACRY